MKSFPYGVPALAYLRPENPLYPPGVTKHLGKMKAAVISALGNSGLLKQPKLGLFCSVRCRGALILRTYEFVKKIPLGKTVMVSGFHSPLERQCLEVLLRRHIPVIMCPIRNLERMRLPPEWRLALAGERLLILSLFPARLRRSTRELAFQRNRFVAALADRVLIPYASAGGNTERFAREVREWGKPLLTFHGEGNEVLIGLGAEGIDGES